MVLSQRRSGWQSELIPVLKSVDLCAAATLRVLPSHPLNHDDAIRSREGFHFGMIPFFQVPQPSDFITTEMDTTARTERRPRAGLLSPESRVLSRQS